MICPHCNAENIDGSDLCAECGQPLTDSHLPEPATAVERGLLSDRVRDLNPNAAIVVSPTMRIRDVLNVLIEKRIGCVFVVDEGTAVGVFTERDALKRIGTRLDELADAPISQVMTQNPQSLDMRAKIAFAVRMMDLGGYRHIPIVDEQGHPTGVISVRDILGYLSGKITAGS